MSRSSATVLALALIASLGALSPVQAEPQARTLAQAPSGAAAPDALMSIEPSGARMGEPLTLTLAVAHRPDETVVFPELPVVWGDFEIGPPEPPETLSGPGGAQTRLRIRATAWMTGALRAPDVAVGLTAADGRSRELVVPGAAYAVAAVLQPGDLAPRSPRPPVAAELRPAWQRSLLAGLLLVALLGLLALSLRRAFAPAAREAEAEAPAFDTPDAHALAQAMLDRLAARDLPASGRFRQHYAQVTACLRHFLEGVHGVPALERTTRETAAALRNTPAVPADTAAALVAFLREADHVKFAGQRPEVATARAAIPRARTLVDALWAARPRPVAEESPDDPARETESDAPMTDATATEAHVSGTSDSPAAPPS